METFIRILSAVLILFSLYMGFKHGLAMALAKPEMIEMFGKWNISKTGIQVLGVIGLLATVMIIFPQTFVWGNLITSAMILFIMAQFLAQKDLKGFLIELPFFLLPLLLIFLQHPLAKSSN
jgi:hypothetical protein